MIKFHVGDIVNITEFHTANIKISNFIARIVRIYEHSCLVECQDIPRELNSRVVIPARNITDCVKVSPYKPENFQVNKDGLLWVGPTELPSTVTQPATFNITYKNPTPRQNDTNTDVW